VLRIVELEEYSVVHRSAGPRGPSGITGRLTSHDTFDVDPGDDVLKEGGHKRIELESCAHSTLASFVPGFDHDDRRGGAELSPRRSCEQSRGQPSDESSRLLRCALCALIRALRAVNRGERVAGFASLVVDEKLDSRFRAAPGDV